MQALYELVHSLAKEEKRLYNMHGRKSRFTQIYKGYLASSNYNKNLDREIFDKHFSSFSKAFYSMQKNALLDDLLAVLLEYSNSSREDFSINRLKAKYEVLKYKGFHGQALNYIRAALEACDKVISPRLRLRLLEDYRDTLAQSSAANWDEYSEILSEIESTTDLVRENEPLESEQQKLDVLVNSAKVQPDEIDAYKDISSNIVDRIRELAEKRPNAETKTAAFDSEYLFSKTFEDKFELHKRLISLEKESIEEKFPKDVRLQVVCLLLESSLECGDFLLINGLIYKTEKDIQLLTPIQKRKFLPKYLELCSIYYFYENDLPLAQKKISELLQLEEITEEARLRYYFHKISIQIAANLPSGASRTLNELMEQMPKMGNDLSVKVMELVVAVGQNNKEEALVMIQRMRSLLRKNPDSRKLSHYRSFFDMLQKFLTRKSFQWQEIPAFETDWNELFKLNLWLKAKIDNTFYYNSILQYWQGRKKILNF